MIGAMRRMTAITTVAVCLVFVSQASATFSPKIAATTDEIGNTTLSYTQSATDDPVAALTFYVPGDFLGTLAGRAEGEIFGTATATIVAGDLGGTTVPVSGTIAQAHATTMVTVAGSSIPLSTAATVCTGTATHGDFWLLNLSAAGQTLQVPVFVDQLFPGTPLGDLLSFTLTMCLPPPDVPPGTPGRAALGAKLLNATLHLNNVFSLTPGWYVWHLQATPYTPATGKANPAGTIEAEGQDRSPQSVSLLAKRRAAKGTVTAHGTVMQGNKGVVGATVKIMAGNKVVGSVKSKSGGAFSIAVKTAAGKLSASATASVRDLPACVEPLFAPLPCVSSTVGGFTVKSDAVTVKR